MCLVLFVLHIEVLIGARGGKCAGDWLEDGQGWGNCKTMCFVFWGQIHISTSL